MGTNTDPYQRAEGRYHLTQGIIGVLSDARNPFSVLTKSPLIRCATSTCSRGARRTDVDVSLSIGTLDAEVWSSPSRVRRTPPAGRRPWPGSTTPAWPVGCPWARCCPGCRTRPKLAETVDAATVEPAPGRSRPSTSTCAAAAARALPRLARERTRPGAPRVHAPARTPAPTPRRRCGTTSATGCGAGRPLRRRAPHRPRSVEPARRERRSGARARARPPAALDVFDLRRARRAGCGAAAASASEQRPPGHRPAGVQAHQVAAGWARRRPGAPPSASQPVQRSSTTIGTGLVVCAVCGPPVAGSIICSQLPWSAVTISDAARLSHGLDDRGRRTRPRLDRLDRRRRARRCGRPCRRWRSSRTIRSYCPVSIASTTSSRDAVGAHLGLQVVGGHLRARGSARGPRPGTAPRGRR